MNTIHPISTRNNIYFCQNKKRNEQQNSQDTDIFMSKKQLEKERNISFVKGLACASAILFGVHTCQNDRNFILEQLSCEVEAADPETSKLKVIDATDDDVPDIIIEDKCGMQSIFDINNNHLYYKDGDELEKIY